jgi:hypothetical protein
MSAAQSVSQSVTEQVGLAVVLQTRIREVLGSILCQEIGYPDWHISVSSVPTGKRHDGGWGVPPPPPVTWFPVRHAPVSLPLVRAAF